MAKAQTKKELAEAYKISYYTLQQWLKPFLQEIGPYRGRMFSPKQVAIIYEKLGSPTEQETS